MENSRGNWSSNIGFLLAAIGSAVGLGNLWGFPYKMGANGGFAFLIVYLVLAAMVGFVIMVSEIAIGRKTGLGVVGAFREYSKRCKWVGFLGLIVPIMVMFFYSVLGAYCIEYIAINLGDLGFNALSASGGELFEMMLTNPVGCIVFTFFFILICFMIVKSGISGGIEKFNKIGMPALFVLLVIVIIKSVSLPGASAGLEFMFKPDFTYLSQNFVKVLSVAGGQMFFSLSLAMGVMVTFGSYLGKGESITKNAAIITISDTLVAVMAGIAVLPAAFALGGEDAAMSGPKLLFITLQDVFSAMGDLIGPLFGVFFYTLVLLAALSSAISLAEVPATMYVDNCHKKGKEPNRSKATFIVCAIIFIGAVIVAADGLGSNGLWVPFQDSLGVNGWNDCWLDFFDFISEGVMMPLGALFTSIIVGWIMKPDTVHEEVIQDGNKFTAYGFYKFCIRFFVPIAMIFILIGQVDAFLGLGIF